MGGRLPTTNAPTAPTSPCLPPLTRTAHLHRHVFRRALAEDELAQRLDAQPAPQHALHGRHARVVPAPHQALVDKLGELALGQHRVHKVEPLVVWCVGWCWGVGVWCVCVLVSVGGGIGGGGGGEVAKEKKRKARVCVRARARARAAQYE